MAKMPHLGTTPKGNALVNIGTLVYIYLFFQFSILNSTYHPKGCLVSGYLAMG